MLSKGIAQHNHSSALGGGDSLSPASIIMSGTISDLDLGEWTPVMGSMTIAAEGYYAKLGNFVFLAFKADFTGAGTFSGQMAGCPFPNNGGRAAGSLYVGNLAVANIVTIIEITSGSSVLNFQKKSASATAWSTITNTDLTIGGGWCSGTIMYKTDS